MATDDIVAEFLAPFEFLGAYIGNWYALVALVSYIFVYLLVMAIPIALMFGFVYGLKVIWDFFISLI